MEDIELSYRYTTQVKKRKHVLTGSDAFKEKEKQ
jgi:hypothetical protein